MSVNVEELTQTLSKQIEEYVTHLDVSEVGTVVSVGDGVVKIYGISKAIAGELLIFPNNVYGMALNLEADTVGAILLGPDASVKEGDEVKRSGKVVEVPVGEALLGRVVDGLGQAVDGLGDIKTKTFLPVETNAPGVVDRQPVKEPLQTGIMSIDAMIPVGRGQRELIIGDRKTGKTAIALDAILNQKGSGVKCIYVAIGQKRSTVAQIRQILADNGALEYTTIVAATASEPASLQYLAAIVVVRWANIFGDKGEHALIIYDDLSKHAVAYRQIALLLRRPPGR